MRANAQVERKGKRMDTMKSNLLEAASNVLVAASAVPEELVPKLEELRKAVNAIREHSVDEENREIIQMAMEQHERPGEVEVEPDGVVSISEDNGAYVQAWVWVSFADTKFDQEKEEA